MKRQSIRTVLCGVATALACAFAWPTATAAQDSFSFDEGVKVALSDGTSLAANVYLPKDGERFPVVLVRTPYSRFQLGQYIAEPLAERGFAVVMQDVRGMGDSDGTFVPFIKEKQDGLDTLDWIAQQPWCDGNIGMWGASYLGFCALIVAPEQHPNLKAIFNISGWGNTDEMTSPGGAMHLMVGLPWTLSGQIRRQGSIHDIDWPTAFRQVPITQIPSSLGIDSTQWEAAVELYTGDFLAQVASIKGSYDQIETPVFHMTGWNDFVARNTLDVYEGIDQARRENGGRAVQKLLVGPWHHDQQWGDETVSGDEDFGPDSVVGMEKIVDLSGRWFDHWLKNADNGVMEENPVKLFIMGSNEWRSFESWPPADARLERWYFSSTSDARSSSGDGVLATDAPDSGSDAFTYDPMDPVPTTGGANFHGFPDNVGVLDQRSVEERQDVLVYTSAPLAEEITIAGPLQAVVYAATEGLHADFTVKLVEVRANGYARIIEDGIRRGPDDFPLRTVRPIEPGRVYRYTIEMGGTGIAIPKGSRLRVEISSSNFPKYSRNPGTGENPESASEFRKTVQTIHHSKQHPSHILLPVLREPAR